MLRFQPIPFLGQTNSFSLSKYSLTRKWGSGLVGYLYTELSLPFLGVLYVLAQGAQLLLSNRVSFL